MKKDKVEDILINNFLKNENEKDFYILLKYMYKEKISEINYQKLCMETKNLAYRANFYIIRHRFLETIYLLEKAIKINPKIKRDDLAIIYVEAIYNTGAIQLLNHEIINDVSYINKIRIDIILNQLLFKYKEVLRNIKLLLEQEIQEYDINLINSIMINIKDEKIIEEIKKILKGKVGVGE